MNFHFIYVEDEQEHRKRLRDAVNRHNRKRNPVVLRMTPAKNIDELRRCLANDKDVDLVLADVYYESGTGKSDRLTDIIDAVRAIAASDSNRQPVPIISYTSYGEQALEACLERREHLLDIWDKGTAVPSYATWRLSMLAVELSRLRPDTFLQRLIQGMPPGASWHSLVKDMPNSCNIGKTEFGQLEGLKAGIEGIAQSIHIYEPARDMWKVMLAWERLSRGVSRSVRGHARHVVNVFWMGYFILHHELLRKWFADHWGLALSRRADELEKALSQSQNDLSQPLVQERIAALRKIVNEGALSESLSNAWFMAGIFHDVAGCVPKYPELEKVGEQLINEFGCKSAPLPEGWIAPSFKDDANALFGEMDTNVAVALQPLWELSLRGNHPDHGMVAAIHLRNRLRDSRQSVAAWEAARAVAVHNLIGEVSADTRPLFSWERDPLTCLLILCDQIQTWDRERGDEDFLGPDVPSRAQLTDLDVQDGSRPKLEMSVEYFVPSHLEHSPILYQRVKMGLESVLREKPTSALARIEPQWPFDLEVKCSLSGQTLGQGIAFGSADAGGTPSASL